MFGVLLRSVALTLLLLQPKGCAAKDLLTLFQPKPDLPQQLNDFLNDVQQHKRDFAFIRHAAKNQKKYEKSFQEGSDLLAEDIENQFNLNPDLGKKDNDEGNGGLRSEEDDQGLPYSEGDIYAGFAAPRFREHYPNERYSRNIHSPIRLRRELENSYHLEHRVDTRPNSQFGNIKRAEQKYPSNFKEDENKYRTGHVMGIDEDYYDEEREVEGKKRRREVEINIKSDGKLVKHIEEDDEGPKSIVLNIKANSNSGVKKNDARVSTELPSAVDKNPAPENSDTIPSVANNGNTNQNGRNIGVPINSIPAKNNLGNSGTFHSLTEVGRVSKFDQAVGRPLNTIYNDMKWSGQNNHMAKSIDIAQSNLNNFKDHQSPNLLLNEEKKDDFEKVQGVVVDGTSVNGNQRFMKRENQQYDYFEPLDLGAKSNLESSEHYEVIEKSTKSVLVIPLTTSECPTTKSKHQKEAEAIGKAIAEHILQEEETTECTTPGGEERFKIIRHQEEDECDDSTTERIRIIHEHRRGHKQRRTAKGKRKKPFEQIDLAVLRNRKHLPTVPKYKRKRVRQHQKKKRIDREAASDYYDLNDHYAAPNNAFDYIPSYRRSLKTVDYDYDPHVIQDVGNHEEQQIQKFVGTLDTREDAAKESAGVRKKFKTEGDYSDEEDSMTSSPHKKVPVKKTQNQFAFDSGATTEENDDDYDYSDLTNMEDEDEDITYEEVDRDKMDLEEAVDNNSKREHETEDERRLTTQNVISGSAIMSVEDMLMEADQMLAGAHAHGGAGKKMKKKKQFVGDFKVDQKSQDGRDKRSAAGLKHKRRRKRGKKTLKNKHKAAYIDHEESLRALEQDSLSNFHSHGSRLKPKQPALEKIKREEINVRNYQDNNKPLTEQEKQDIFLRYNPEFQRWPRFVQDDQKYHEMMRKRALEDRQKYFEGGKSFPFSNEYILKPKQVFVKREDPTTEAEASASSEAASTEAAEEASSSTAASSNGDTSSESAGESEASASSQAGETSPPEGGASADNNGAALLDTGSATLPQAAQNILQTANSDIFENTTVPELGALQGGNGNNGAASGVAQRSTEFEFTTIAEDLTQNTQCDNGTQRHIEPCDDENAKHNPGTVTSVLPLANEAATEKLNLTKDQFLDLDDILVGMLPKDVVLESLSNARGGVRNGLKAAKYNMNLPLSTYNISAETSMLLTEMAGLIKKLKYHSICQPLPTNLKTYLKIITKNEMDDPMTKLKEMNEIDFDDHQSNYVFHSAQNENIHDKAQVLRDLLGKYQQLPAECKERAEPVKEYIESHLAMIEHMGGGKKDAATAAPNGVNSSAKPKAKKETNIAEAEEEKLEKKVVEEGLENQKADANEIIEDMEEKSKREAVDAFMVMTSTSPQFGKLAKAVRNVRSRRQVIKRIGEIFGKTKPKLEKIEDKRGFESPRVINFS